MPGDGPVQQALRTHAKQVDATVARFLAELEHVVEIAQSKLQGRLLRLLKLDHELKIIANLANQRILRRIPLLWQQALDDAGLEGVIQRYMDTFPAQIPAFKEVLKVVNEQAAHPLPLPDFTKSDLAYLNSTTLSAGSDVSAIVENAAASGITRITFGLGTVKFHDLLNHIIKATNASKAKAASLADTSLMGFYRSVAASGYEKIQSKIDKPLLYRYLGPQDSLTRPFCERMLELNKEWTWPELERLENGTNQPKPVTVYCGGWLCRHSICLSATQSL